MGRLLTWWIQFVNKMNEQGIPIPMIKANGKPTITGTMVVISFALCSLPVLLMVGTVITKLTGIFTLNDANQAQLLNSFNCSIQLLIASLGGYLGRGMQRDDKGKINLLAAEAEAKKIEPEVKKSESESKKAESDCK